ncbi:MAG TPA: hypothetical protein VHU42_08000 [Rhodopila sp.]|nr:hypothetical protein [Rhodopila sp.]
MGDRKRLDNNPDRGPRNQRDKINGDKRQYPVAQYSIAQYSIAQYPIARNREARRDHDSSRESDTSIHPRRIGLMSNENRRIAHL